MRGLGFGLAALAAAFGFVAGCGGTEEAVWSDNDAGSASQAASGAGGAATAGKGGASPGGSSAGTTIGSASASGSTSGGTSGGTSAGSNEGGSNEGGSAGATVEGGAPGGGKPGLSDCDAKKVTCKIATPQCAAFEVPSVDGSCWGQCVPIAQCACSAADDCPDQNQYTCWSKQHCGPYVL
jgi:hypothetical protein